ncbi:MAG: hypothetical protein ABI743_09070, partial [bacterium]
LAAAVCGLSPVTDPYRNLIDYSSPYLKQEYGTDPDFWKVCSPWHRVVDGATYPAFLLIGDCHDFKVPFLGQAARLAVRLEEANPNTSVLLVPRTGLHSPDEYSSDANEEMIDFLTFFDRELRPPATD